MSMNTGTEMNEIKTEDVTAENDKNNKLRQNGQFSRDKNISKY